MNDDFLHTLRAAPRRDFANDLYAHLAQLEEEQPITIISSALPAVANHVAVRRAPRSFMTLVAAVFALILLGTVLLYAGRSSPSIVGNIPLSLDDLPSLTNDNAGQLSEIKRLGNGSLNAVTWSPDGKTLAVTGGRGVWLFDAADPTAAPRLLESRTAAGILPEAAFSPDGRLIAARDGNSVRIMAADTGAVMAVLSGHTSPIYALAFSPDGQLIASASGSWYDAAPDNSVRLWDVASGQGRIISEGHYPAISVTFSPDGTQLAADTANGLVYVWDVQSGAEQYQINRTSNSSTGLAFSPDGARLATAESHGFGLWDAATGEEMTMVKISSDDSPFVSDMVFTPDSHRVILGTRNNGIVVWNTETQQFEDHPRLGSLADALSIGLSPDGQTLAVLGLDSILRLWDWQADTEIAAVRGYMGQIYGLSLHGQQVAYGRGQTIEVRDLETGALDLTIGAGLDLLSSLVYSPDGATLAYSGWKSLRVRSLDVGEQVGLRRIDAVTGAALPTLAEDAFYSLSAIAFSPDGRYLAGSDYTGSTNYYDRSIELWDLSQQPPPEISENRLEQNSPDQTYNNLVYSPLGDWLAATDGSGLVVAWNLETGEQRTIRAADPIRLIYDDSLAFSPDGVLLAIAYPSDNHGSTSMVELVDFASGELILTLDHDTENSLSDVAFSPDGTLLATAAPGKLYLWDTNTGKRLYEGEQATGVISLAFDAAGRFIVTGGWDGLLRVWGVR